MIKKVTIICATLAFICGFMVVDVIMASADNGPETMVLKTTKDKAKKPRTVNFPHKNHQERLKCGECHHTKGDDGKQKEYTEGMKIQKCEECHFKGSGMPNKKPNKLSTFKDVAHANCKNCHKEAKAKDPELKAKWKKCLPCHEGKK